MGTIKLNKFEPYHLFLVFEYCGWELSHDRRLVLSHVLPHRRAQLNSGKYSEVAKNIRPGTQHQPRVARMRWGIGIVVEYWKQKLPVFIVRLCHERTCIPRKGPADERAF